MKSKGTYTLINKNDNFPEGKIDYDFNNITGFSSVKAMQYLQKQGYTPAVTANDPHYNACLFALASGKDMSEIMSLPMADFTAVAYTAMGFFGSGLVVESESSTPAETIEN